MKRVIKYDFISESSSKLQKKIEELIQLKDKLKVDIDKVKLDFQGKDADSIVDAYSAKISMIDKYIVVVAEYQNYFEWLGGNYKDVHSKFKQEVEVIKEELDSMNGVPTSTIEEGGIIYDNYE